MLFSPLALVATMFAQSPSRSNKSSRASGSTKGTKRARKAVSHPQKGLTPEKASKEQALVASEPTGAMSSEVASAFVAKKNERDPLLQASLSEVVGSSPAKKPKACSFLCGSVCFQTPDPVSPERDSIRWAYDSAADFVSKGEGASCWYCSRAWAENAHDSGHRDRATFQKEIAKDKTKLEAFLRSRDKIVKRSKSALEAKAEKRSSGVKRVSVHTKEFKTRVRCRKIQHMENQTQGNIDTPIRHISDFSKQKWLAKGGQNASLGMAFC